MEIAWHLGRLLLLARELTLIQMPTMLNMGSAMEMHNNRIS